MKGLVLATTAMLAVGCVSVAPVATSAPTSAPTAAPTIAPVVTAAPTPAPTPRPTLPPTPPPTPRPVEAGTSWLTYLNWAMQAAQDNQAILTRLQNASGMGSLMYLSGEAYDMLDTQNRWLDSHPPQACYQVTWDAHQRMVHSLMAAFGAIRDGDFDNGSRLLDVALLDSQSHTDAISLATC